MSTIAMALLMAGCATSLTQKALRRDKIKDIVVGKTTQRDVFKTFGKPLYHGSRSAEESWWMYIRTTDESSESLSFYFDKEGLVSDFLYTPPDQRQVSR